MLRFVSAIAATAMLLSTADAYSVGSSSSGMGYGQLGVPPTPAYPGSGYPPQYHFVKKGEVLNGLLKLSSEIALI